MCRIIFLILTVIGCGILIPINISSSVSQTTSDNIILQFTPAGIPTGSSRFWANVVVVYLFNIIICFFLWYNYRIVAKLRRAHFETPEYKASSASRTLLITEIPNVSLTDDGLQRIMQETNSQTLAAPHTAIARDLGKLPAMITEHTELVERLEEVLAKYLKYPDKPLGPRPTCRPSSADKTVFGAPKVDAINYLRSRIRDLESKIEALRKAVREKKVLAVDDALRQHYGFATYTQISDAHATAYKARKGGAQKTHIRLAPKPNDLIWVNLSKTIAARKRSNVVNNLWVALLTFFWIIPNLLFSVFLANLSNLGLAWPAFERNFYAHPTIWSIIQGILAPALTSLVYLVLPIIFRRLSIKAGDLTKTSRERHVLHKLFSFFVFNNLIVFSIFSGLWSYIAALVAASRRGENVGKTFVLSGRLWKDLESALLSASTFWLTWLLQRSLGAALDLIQIINLSIGPISRRFFSPTPRQLIKMSAPQAFDYAVYYNYFLFYIAVTLCYAPLQPLCLAPTAFYFLVDSYMKKYLLMYVLITKTESNGKFWRVVFNRCLVCMFLGTAIVALLVISKGDSWAMFAVVCFLFPLLFLFKWYCSRKFDVEMEYYTTQSEAERDGFTSDAKAVKMDQVVEKYQHPLLSRKLLRPMVNAKAQHLLPEVTGETDFDVEQPVYGDSGVTLNKMSHGRPGRSSKKNQGFEIVKESDMDFDHFKDRADFASGGVGELYGRPTGLSRKESDQTTMTGLLNPRSESRSSSTSSHRVNSSSLEALNRYGGITPPPYRQSFGRYESPVRDGHSSRDRHEGREGHERHERRDGRFSDGSHNDDDRHSMNRGRSGYEESLLARAQQMGRSTPRSYSPYRGGPTTGASTVTRWAPIPTEIPPEDVQPTNYDYFRGEHVHKK